MIVVWVAAAERDREAIFDHIYMENRAAAMRMDVLFSEAVAKLAEFPMLGRAGEIAGTREVLPHKSYRLIYEVEGETVWILALIHTARLWPPAA